MSDQAYTLWNRRVPLRYEADIAIFGGGMAGVSAALAAARSGSKVILVERFAVTGGNATVGGVGEFCGETAGQGEVFDEIISELERFGAVNPYVPYPKATLRYYNHEYLAVILQEMLLRRGVKLLLHTQFIDVSVSDDGRIKECIVSGKSGPEALRAKQFIDCTGEAQVAHMADFATMKGRPSDGLQLPMSLMFYIRHVPEENQKCEIPEGWLEPIRDKDSMPMTSKSHAGINSNGLKVKIPMFDATDTESATAAEIAARRRMVQVLDYYQRVEKRPWVLDHCSQQIGIREGRRIVGDYILHVDDLRAGRKFDDAVARGTYYLDAHKPDDDQKTYILDRSELRVPPYQIPLRTLLAKDGINLATAGRSLSADQLALSSARVLTSTSMMGQAVGILAALSVEKNCDLRDVDPLEVQRIVIERGANLEV